MKTLWWFLYGAALGVGGTLLIERSTGSAWYAWPVLVLGLGLGTLAVHHYFASRVEQESKAARVGLLLFGLPAAALLGISGWLFA
ncbi:MAG: dehalogenase [Rhodospirillaceae bacterium]|jgi:hypothetical protein|nr:dehalogenase [Rhodospirillaceae bacterium]|tara:strand:+ start:2644 stop:2898 length:255 start_codon:yes stop_codon:yes gene_type:complete